MKKSRGDTLYNRSFFLTMGGLMLMLPIWIWIAQGRQSGNWPLFAWILYYCLPVAGIFTFGFGILASDKKIDSTIYIEPTGRGLLMAILAYPLYLILKWFKRRK